MQESAKPVRRHTCTAPPVQCAPARPVHVLSVYIFRCAACTGRVWVVSVGKPPRTAAASPSVCARSGHAHTRAHVAWLSALLLLSCDKFPSQNRKDATEEAPAAAHPRGAGLHSHSRHVSRQPATERSKGGLRECPVMWKLARVQLFNGRRLFSTASSKTCILEEVRVPSPSQRGPAAPQQAAFRVRDARFAGERISGHHHPQSAEGAQRPVAHAGAHCI